jgi:hypothetical protein
MRSTVADGVLFTKLPAAHVDHGLHAAALLLVLNCPLPHDEHTRSAIAVPSDATKVPGVQEVLATQGVAALPS